MGIPHVFCVVAIAFISGSSAACPAQYPGDANATIADAFFPTTVLQGSPSLASQIIYRYNEVVQLAYPPAPDLLGEATQRNCPHWASGLVPWDTPSAWVGGVVPAADRSNVTLNTNTRVLVSSCSLSPGVYGYITIPPTSAVIFSDANISLSTMGISVQGSLTIGSPTCRLKSFITITLHGSRNSQALPADPIVKGIAVSGGTLDIHGHYFVSWSRLAMSAAVNATQIYVQDLVNWQPGQEIFITTTQVKDSRDWHQNEVVTVVNVTVASFGTLNVSLVTFQQRLQFAHYGGSEYQAEVGLLSRRIVIQGSATDSEPTDINPVACSNSLWTRYPCENSSLTGFGGHVIVIGSSSIGRVRGVQLYRMGQTNVLGRYAMHFHFVGLNGNLSYFQDSSVHRSFYRGAVVHATNYTLVSNNVAFDVIGHCYYLEDGVEEFNTISYNLAAFIHFLGVPPGAAAQQTMSDIFQNGNLTNPADSTASGYYISNSYNYVRGNAASGGWAGFSFPSTFTVSW